MKVMIYLTDPSPRNFYSQHYNNGLYEYLGGQPERIKNTSICVRIERRNKYKQSWEDPKKTRAADLRGSELGSRQLLGLRQRKSELKKITMARKIQL